MTAFNKALLNPALALAGLSAAAGLLIWGMTADGRSRLTEAADRSGALYAEETALLARVPAPDAARGGSTLPEGLAWPEPDLGAAELAMQQTLLAAAETAGLALLSFGATGPVDNGPVPALGYQAELEGGHAEIVAFLAAIEQAQPGLSVGSLWMRQLPPLADQQIAMVSLRITLWGLAPRLAEGNPG